MPRFSSLLFGATAIFLLALSAPALADAGDGVPGPAADGKIVGAWTQFVAHDTPGHALASPAVELRFVVQTVATPARGDDQYCADFAVAYVTSGKVQGITNKLTPRTNPGKYNFPVAVCALALDADWSHVKLITAQGNVSDPALYIWDESGQTSAQVAMLGPYQIGRNHMSVSGKPELQIVTLGDSGCRGPNTRSKRDIQDCNSSSTWPLTKIAGLAVQYQPDAVVHVGDYRYYKGNYKGQRTNSDNWSFWLKDFIAPTQNLLLAAPWALTRGNHEDCGSGGPGYFYLFGATAATAQCGSNPTGSWYFDIAPGGIDSAGKADAPHRFVMVDTSADSRSAAQANFETAIDVSNQPNSWWVSHIPPLHLVSFPGGGDPSRDPDIAGGLDDALKNKGTQLCDSSRSPKPTCIPSTLLLGHDHMFQKVEFKDVAGQFLFPQIYIVGHGGVNLRGAGLKGSPCSYRYANLPGQGVSLQAKVTTRKDFGFVVWKRSLDSVDTPSGWVADEQWVSSRGTLGPAGNCL